MLIINASIENMLLIEIVMYFLFIVTGIAAATMFMPDKQTEVSETQLRVAFDGDAVLFSDESERIFKAHGLDKFFEHERENENTLLDHVSMKMFQSDFFCHTMVPTLRAIMAHKNNTGTIKKMERYLRW